MQRMVRAMVVTSALLAFLNSCSNLAVVATPTSVSGSASNLLKIGTAVQFTATGANGASLDSTTVTWSSSNAAVASVDASGRVTAHRLGTVTVSATAGGQTKVSAAQTTYGMEFAVGTFNRSALGLPNVFAHFVKVRLPDGSAPPLGSGVDITGPSGWNGGAPDPGLTVNTGTTKYAIGLNTNPPTAGTYSATATIQGEAYTAQATLDASSLLPPVSNITVTNSSASSINVTWTAAAGAVSYTPILFDCGIVANPTPAGCNTVVQRGLATQGTSTTLSGLSLAVGRTYALTIRAANVDLTQADPATPAQINLSVNGTYVKLSTP
ncbi:Ig-like domain-containing protein [Deinococcus hopiensis]|uniref:Ig-like domain (Group 2) n=1 Tax=Deinococcus hopiensis KR-140 TaxID=695939 RepID=A0A1W1UL17_9DEIO|nr:Ig-like domain-containing protein [Deinococcus hopiensis]SMB81786.1 Ig-like domain (group 2) [Deinococcus hopiensis KR-140]